MVLLYKFMIPKHTILGHQFLEYLVNKLGVDQHTFLTINLSQ